MRRLLAVSAAISVAALAALSAHADLLPPGGGRPQPREIAHVPASHRQASTRALTQPPHTRASTGLPGLPSDHYRASSCPYRS